MAMTRRVKDEGGSASVRGAPRGVLGLLTVVLTVVFSPLAVVTWRQARADWLSVRSDGVVVGVRSAKYARPLPRARGPWHVIWEVDCETDGTGRVAVTAPGSYRRETDALEASRGDMGRGVSVWHVPGDHSLGRLDPPDRTRGLFAAAWTTGMAAIGWLGVAAFAQLAWRKLRRPSAEGEPGATTERGPT